MRFLQTITVRIHYRGSFFDAFRNDAERSTAGEHCTLEIFNRLATRGTRKSQSVARLADRSALMYELWQNRRAGGSSLAERAMRKAGQQARSATIARDSSASERRIREIAVRKQKIKKAKKKSLNLSEQMVDRKIRKKKN